MKVQDLGANRPDVTHRKSVTDAAPVDTPALDQKAVSRTDRVEISARAREVSADQRRLKREIDFARRAMYSMPPLSKERAQEILKSLEQGLYYAPDVRMKLAKNLSNAFDLDAPELSPPASILTFVK